MAGLGRALLGAGRGAFLVCAIVIFAWPENHAEAGVGVRVVANDISNLHTVFCDMPPSVVKWRFIKDISIPGDSSKIPLRFSCLDAINGGFCDLAVNTLSFAFGAENTGIPVGLQIFVPEGVADRFASGAITFDIQEASRRVAAILPNWCYPPPKNSSGVAQPVNFDIPHIYKSSVRILLISGRINQSGALHHTNESHGYSGGRNNKIFNLFQACQQFQALCFHASPRTANTIGKGAFWLAAVLFFIGGFAVLIGLAQGAPY